MNTTKLLRAVRRDPARAVVLLRQASRSGLPVATHLTRNVIFTTTASVDAK